MGIVETYLVQQKGEDAIKLLQAESEKNPKRLDYRMALGNTAVRTGKYDMAISQYQGILGAVDANSRQAAEIYLRLGETYRRKGDLNNGLAMLQKARAITPENSGLVLTLALTLDGAGKKLEAKHAYEQVVKLDPANPYALNNLAYLMAESGDDLDQALTFAQRAKQILPTLNEVSDTLGWIYLKKNLSDSAIGIFQDLVKKEPRHSTYRYHLGMAFAQKGDKPRAQKELMEAIKSNPAKEEEAKIKELLGKLG
jgi:tetratricopeptide (TPR) repeat protein